MTSPRAGLLTGLEKRTFPSALPQHSSSSDASEKAIKYLLLLHRINN